MSSNVRFCNSISDPLYGTIPLTDIEVRVINCQSFQRLRRIQQLGLLGLVFPSADYSRFTHSLGACHVLNLIVESLRRKTLEIDEKVWQELRLSMLLHDIGHYPMSHATEHAAKQFYREKTVNLNGNIVSIERAEYINHEQAGKRVVLYDRELHEVLADFDIQKIVGTFTREQETPLLNLVSSEMDADRLDYLKRSSQATGLPYGNYDRDYLIEQLEVDGKGNVCLNKKAIRAADHFLMCRSFDYLQTIFHKAVVGFERMLELCVVEALGANKIDLSKDNIERAIRNDEWCDWDDLWLMNRLKEFSKQSDCPAKVRYMAERVISRKPAQCLWNFESLNVDDDDVVRAQVLKFLELCNADGIVSENAFTWEKKFSPTDVSPSRHTLNLSGNEEEENKLIRISDGNGGSLPLIQHDQSLLKVLGERAYVFGRVYFVGPESRFKEVQQKVVRIANERNLEAHCHIKR